ncbi:Nephrocystin-4 [Stylophora pistillata]|uniref:Nephrocystin-4 n=1 Tax=Stylophora pistillata TaxID=50429 RepID=A0A2B4S4R6_STYPI|nr:Nephrocystin-4 [Stylophora pistillata]
MRLSSSFSLCQGNKSTKIKAKQMAECDAELSAVLFSRQEKITKDDQPVREADAIRKRKLERMQAVRQTQGAADTSTGNLIIQKEEKLQRTRDLKTIQLYREKLRHEKILALLAGNITTSHTIHPLFGRAEFFEFVLRNPYSTDQTVTIHCDDNELKVITDTREWRHFKRKTETRSATKSLGVIIDDKLDWHSHIEKLTKKIASGIGALKRIRRLIPASTLHLIYQALVKPHFDYCDIVWGSCGKTLRDKLQKLQNRAARVLTFSNYDADATELLEFLGWKNLARQQEIHKATMMFRCLHGLAPRYLYSKFTWRDSAYDLRDSENKLNVPLPRTNYYRKSFSYNGATLWNSLPRDIRNTESLGLFKRAPVMDDNTQPQVHVRCSDVNAVCEARKKPSGEPQDVFLKIACGPSPSVKRFFVLLFIDPFLAEPCQTWQLYVHSLQRLASEKAFENAQVFLLY